ncbi:GGDEF domain-containing protein [Acetobacterium sp.]|uniref:GGDEF domain-containing protein n=1 Tax=Acetobacterium sp. TaxID=1872094 RepID=UPI0035937416
MNLNDKKIDRSVLMILIPIAILLVLILILLYNFGSASRHTAKSMVENALLKETGDFAAQINDELDVMTRMGEAFRDMIILTPVNKSIDTLPIIGTLCNNSDAYMVVYCNAEGVGLTQNGIKVNVSKDNFLNPENNHSQYYAYLQKENIMQAEAVVSVIPIIKEDQVDGYILMYYSVSRIRKIFTQTPAFADAFFIFSVDEGLIITTEDLNAPPPVGTTQLQLLAEMDPAMDPTPVQAAMANQQNFSLNLAIKDDPHYVIYSPIGINAWYIAIGFEEAQYDQLLIDQWGSMRNLITYLLVVIFIFVFGVIGTMVLMRIFYQKHHRKLQTAVDLDLLTGLNNKMATERKIKQYLIDHPETSAILCVLDLDNFKEINDSLGHVVGDDVLKMIGAILRDRFGDDHVVGRVGGDEFIIFIKAITTAAALVEIQKVRDLIDTPVLSGETEIAISFSIGVAEYPADAADFKELYTIADNALYQAKKNGKNQLYKAVNKQTSINESEKGVANEE